MTIERSGIYSVVTFKFSNTMFLFIKIYFGSKFALGLVPEFIFAFGGSKFHQRKL